MYADTLQNIENLQAQKGQRVRAEDIQEVHEHAQKRAFTKAVAEETLLLASTAIHPDPAARADGAGILTVEG